MYCPIRHGCALCSLAIAFMVTLGGLLWFMSGDIMVLLAERGLTDVAKMVLLIPGADPNHSAQDGRTPLIMAAGQGELSPVRLLIQAGGNVNTGGSEGKTPLFRAVEKNRTTCVQLLLSTPGIDPNRGNTNNGVTLLWVAFNGRTECVRLLLSVPYIQVNMGGS